MLSDSALSGGQVCSLSTALFNAALDVHRRRDLDIECILNPEYDQAHMDPPLLRCRFLGLSLPWSHHQGTTGLHCRVHCWTRT